MLATSPGATITQSGALTAGRHKIFASTSTAISFGRASITEAYPEWWGARAGAGEDYALNSTAIVAAAQAGYKVKFGNGYYYHNGIALVPNATVSEFILEGSGRNKTTLYNQVANNHNISAISSGGTYVGMITVRDLGLLTPNTGGSGTGAGVYLSGAAWWILEDLQIKYHGSHGIHITNNVADGTAGSFIGVIRNNKITRNAGDGIYQVATDSGNQQNSSYILNNEITSNANGLTVWGVGIKIAGNTIESNTSKGIRVQNFKTAAPAYSAGNISIRENYMEGHPDAMIYVKTSATSTIIGGYLTNLTIQDNYGLYTAGTATYVPVLFEAVGVGNEVRRLNYRNNSFNAGLATVTVEANFGDALSADCVVSPNYALNGTIAELNTLAAKFINLGDAWLEAMKSITLYGYFEAKGGASLTYSSMLKSDNTTTSGANTYFPLRIPIGSAFYMASVPVETDSTNYSVALSWGKRSYNSVAAYGTTSAAVTGNSGTKTVEMYLASYTTANRVSMASLDSILELIVTFVTPGTYFYIGNPTVYYR
jgi:hypothetical protein